MSKEQLATRILSTEALVDSNTLRNGRISGDDWVKLATSAGYLSALPLFIDDTASMTVQQMKAEAQTYKKSRTGYYRLSSAHGISYGHALITEFLLFLKSRVSLKLWQKS